VGGLSLVWRCSGKDVHYRLSTACFSATVDWDLIVTHLPKCCVWASQSRPARLTLGYSSPADLEFAHRAATLAAYVQNAADGHPDLWSKSTCMYRNSSSVFGLVSGWWTVLTFMPSAADKPCHAAGSNGARQEIQDIDGMLNGQDDRL
jgi:hypothetical protein